MARRFFLASFATGLLASCSTQQQPILTYEDCVAAGNVILRSLPPQCVTRDGHRFVKTETVADLADSKLAERSQKVALCKDLCGDGSCQTIVCQGSGCPCSESPQSCPKDCSASLEKH